MHLKSLILSIVLLTITYYSYSQTITGLEVHQGHNVLFGESLSGAGTKLMWIPEKAAFRAGEIVDSLDSWDINSIGGHSIAFGLDNRASGSASTAWGESNIASDFASTAWGINNTASFFASTAWGQDNTASGEGSTAWGNNNTASGLRSTAWGEDNTASGQYNSTAWGWSNTSGGWESTAWGNNNTASGLRSTAWGEDNTASGNYSTAWGSGNYALSDHETVIGRYADTLSHSNSSAWLAEEQLFVVGNGSSTSDRNNAFTILKSGETFIDSTLTINDTLIFNTDNYNYVKIYSDDQLGGSLATDDLILEAAGGIILKLDENNNGISGGREFSIIKGPTDLFDIDNTTVDVHDKKITGVNTPTSAQDAANKDYVDDIIIPFDARLTQLTTENKVLRAELTNIKKQLKQIEQLEQKLNQLIQER